MHMVARLYTVYRLRKQKTEFEINVRYDAVASALSHAVPPTSHPPIPQALSRTSSVVGEHRGTRWTSQIRRQSP